MDVFNGLKFNFRTSSFYQEGIPAWDLQSGPKKRLMGLIQYSSDQGAYHLYKLTSPVFRVPVG